VVVFEELRIIRATGNFPKNYGCIPHSAEGLTEKRISSKVGKNGEGRKSVTENGVAKGGFYG
jgi:hypothetical protein